MKKLATPFLAIGLLAAPFLHSAAMAANCMDEADALARKTGGEVLNVVSAGGNGKTVCEITLRIPGKNGKPPRVVTRKVSD